MHWECLIWPVVTFCVGLLAGGVFCCPRKHAPNPETFALDLTDPGERMRAEPEKSLPVKPTEPVPWEMSVGEMIAVELSGRTNYMVSVPAYCNDCWTMPQCAKCGKDL